MVEYRQKITHKPAFDDLVNGCDHKTKGDHGRGSVKEYWTIKRSDHFGIQWEIYTNWMLPETYEEGRNIHGEPINWDTFRGPFWGPVDYHSPIEFEYGIELEKGKCDITKGKCWLDTGYSIGESVGAVLIREGTQPTWVALQDMLIDWADEILKTYD